jgi:hypothetical protein
VVDGVPVRPFDVDVGKVKVAVVGVTAVGEAALLSTPSLPVAVGGTWGVPTPPSIVSAVAVDSGRQRGLGVNDSLVLHFDQEVRPPCHAQVPHSTPDPGISREPP